LELKFPRGTVVHVGVSIRRADQGALELCAAPQAAYQGLRTATYKYVAYGTGERELYDLVTDPYELKNLAAGADPELLAAL